MNKFIEYCVRDGDTLQMIAQKYMGDASRWEEIAIFNDLQYPFIVSLDKAGDGLKTPGDIILIPVSVQDSSIAEEVLADPYAVLFGSDLSLSSDKVNLSFSTAGEFDSDEYGDLAVVSGISTLSQDLIHRLITPLGSLLYHPDYGSDFLTLVGNRNDVTWRQKAAIEVSRCFLSDLRVKSVDNVVVQKIDGGISISCNITTASIRFKLNEMVA